MGAAIGHTSRRNFETPTGTGPTMTDSSTWSWLSVSADPTYTILNSKSFASGAMTSNVISNWNGVPNGDGLFRIYFNFRFIIYSKYYMQHTDTLLMFTRDIVSF